MSKPSIQLRTHFAVPIAEVRFPDSERLCRELTELFLAKESEGDKWRDTYQRDTQQGIFESGFDLFNWPDPPVQELAKKTHTALVTLVRQLNNYSGEHLAQLRWNYHAWFHVTRTGGYQALHNHPNASWSGIYCVDPGDTVPDRPDSGVVRFHDPKQNADMHTDHACDRMQAPFTMGSFEFRHRAGTLVLFPSYLKHEIFPYVGERPRIVMAFNSWAQQDREDQVKSTLRAIE
ncbi:MAG: hypothetical protein E2O56_01745 [Gammaproteobacteria bacterium]|nr:MAG: hypothetical protein E2O56_01745 [Gammaproteobacteria bacterium]